MAARRADQAEVVCDDDDTAGEPELASPLRRPSEHPLDCLGGPCRGRCTPDGSVATGAYTVPAAVVVVVPGASPPAGCAAAAAYSGGGGTQMPPTTMNCGTGGAGAVLVPVLWTVAAAFGRLVCSRYF